jgi:plasmid maintenance system antidote protein VapI
MAAKKLTDETKRLIALRELHSGDNQTAFATLIGIDVKRWNNFERGSPLSKEIAFILVKKFPGLTTDWLWLGKEEGLPSRLQRELAEAVGKVITSTARGR